jgi:hypothetical protein
MTIITGSAAVVFAGVFTIQKLRKCQSQSQFGVSRRAGEHQGMWRIPAVVSPKQDFLFFFVSGDVSELHFF